MNEQKHTELKQQQQQQKLKQNFFFVKKWKQTRALTDLVNETKKLHAPGGPIYSFSVKWADGTKNARKLKLSFVCFNAYETFRKIDCHSKRERINFQILKANRNNIFKRWIWSEQQNVNRPFHMFCTLKMHEPFTSYERKIVRWQISSCVFHIKTQELLRTRYFC